METMSEIISGFTADERVHFNKIFADKNMICHHTSISFLAEYGLPDFGNLFLVEDLKFFDRDRFSFYEKDKSRVVIGQDSAGFLCVDRNDGSLWSCDPSGETGDCFVSSCIADFIKCLYYYKIYYADLSSQLDEQAEMGVYKKLCGIFDDIDPAILGGEENWWSQVIEPLSYYELCKPEEYD